tara:strand:- start:326 stop:454 length:129 start_codon:yes stop_codon:yes gene_type:complete
MANKNFPSKEELERMQKEKDLKRKQIRTAQINEVNAHQSRKS